MRYEIAFSGQLQPGADAQQVRTNLARLFQADAQRIAQLFSGRRVVIKNNLDADTAEKYRLALQKAGAQAEVCEMAGTDTVPASEGAKAAVQTPSESTAAVVPRDEYMAAFCDVVAPDFGIAPLGADMQDAAAATDAVVVDTSHLSLAPVGSDLGQARGATPASAPDTSHIKLVN